jgi:hypothetical protein
MRNRSLQFTANRHVIGQRMRVSAMGQPIINAGKNAQGPTSRISGTRLLRGRSERTLLGLAVLITINSDQTGGLHDVERKTHS